MVLVPGYHQRVFCHYPATSVFYLGLHVQWGGNACELEVCGSTRTRPVPAGMGRVWVDVLRVGSGTGTKYTRRVYPFSPVKITIFHDVGAISNVLYFFLLKILLTIKVGTIAV